MRERDWGWPPRPMRRPQGRASRPPATVLVTAGSVGRIASPAQASKQLTICPLQRFPTIAKMPKYVANATKKEEHQPRGKGEAPSDTAKRIPMPPIGRGPALVFHRPCGGEPARRKDFQGVSRETSDLRESYDGSVDGERSLVEAGAAARSGPSPAVVGMPPAAGELRAPRAPAPREKLGVGMRRHAIPERRISRGTRRARARRRWRPRHTGARGPYRRPGSSKGSRGRRHQAGP